MEAVETVTDDSEDDSEGLQSIVETSGASSGEEEFVGCESREASDAEPDEPMEADGGDAAGVAAIDADASSDEESSAPKVCSVAPESMV